MFVYFLIHVFISIELMVFFKFYLIYFNEIFILDTVIGER